MVQVVCLSPHELFESQVRAVICNQRGEEVEVMLVKDPSAFLNAGVLASCIRKYAGRILYVEDIVPLRFHSSVELENLDFLAFETCESGRRMVMFVIKNHSLSGRVLYHSPVISRDGGN